jgi:hypothetical protein
MKRGRVAVVAAGVALLPFAFGTPSGAQGNCKVVHTIKVRVTNAGLGGGVGAPRGQTCVNDPIVWEVRNATTEWIEFAVKDFKHNNTPKTVKFLSTNATTIGPGLLGVIAGTVEPSQVSGGSPVTWKYSTEARGLKSNKHSVKDPDLEVDPPPAPFIPPGGRGRGAD